MRKRSSAYTNMVVEVYMHTEMSKRIYSYGVQMPSLVAVSHILLILI
jgi:hypothetical protein